MLRMLAVALLGLALAVVAQADDAKPPWQRLLTGDDARKAADLEKRVVELEAADNYAEAIRRHEELLALRTRVQGADHWQTVNQKWYLTATTKVAALTAEKRAGWRQAERDVAAAAGLVQQAQYGKALTLLQERLKWCREVLGENHPLTALNCNNIAFILNAQGKYAEAGPLYQEALDVRRRVLGEEHPDTAQSYNNVAYNLTDQGKFAEAGPLCQHALDVRRKILGEEHPAVANSCNNVAANLSAQGKYAEAAPLLRKALDIHRKALGEEQPQTATSYNNVAYNLADQGKYAEAELLSRKALEIRRKLLGEEHPDTALSHNNVAANLNGQGKYAEAGPLLQKALDIFRKVRGEEHPQTAASYNNVASNLGDQERYAEAGPLYQKALDIQRKILGEEHPGTAQTCNNVAFNLHAQGKHGEAGPLFQKSLDVKRKALGDDHPFVTVGYYSVAVNLQAQGRYPEALALMEKAARSYEAARLSVAAAGLVRAAFGAAHSPYPLLASARGRAGRAAEAWAALEADLARGLLDELALRRGPALTPAEQRRRDELRALRAPLDARVLALPSRPQRTEAEGAELDRLVAQRRQLEKELAELAARVSQREVAPLARVQAALPADAALVAWVDVGGKRGGVEEHWGCVVRPQGHPRWKRLPGSGPDDRWTDADNALPAQFRSALARSAPAAAVAALGQRLHAQRLAPLGKHLEGVRYLFVASVYQMAGIPVEALTDRYTISYTPSCTYLARLKDRPRPLGTGLLAVGDPVFPPVKDSPPRALPPGGLLITQVLPGSPAANARLQAGDVLVAYAGQDLTSAEQFGKLIATKPGKKAVVAKVWREGQDQLAERELSAGQLGVVVAKEPAREAITARRQADQVLDKLSRGEAYTGLPGTQVEITRLAELFDPREVTTLTRAAASEQQLDALRRAGRLKDFRYLHFATHSKANDVRAFESALLLSPPEQVPEVRVGEPYLEGRLTAGEVLEYWRLDCELVTLSACESGLGRRGGGDGLLGFAQAFLTAGSRSVCLSLWQVDDTATALLMDRFYRNLLGKRLDGGRPMSKAVALREAKEWLRTLTAAEALERLGSLTQGVVRGERPARQEMHAVPRPKEAGPDYKPYAHPRYWAAFILIGDPD
jgi:tetratricopeptide (TPR) repeat protein